MSAPPPPPALLDSSELGTKEYWDNYYQNDLDNDDDDENDDDSSGIASDRDQDKNQDQNDEEEETDGPALDPSDLESWFDDVGAPTKTLEFLTSTTFPLSPNYIPPSISTSHDDNDASTSPIQGRGGGGADGNAQARPEGSHPAQVLDLGTGNGSALFALRLQGQYLGRMVGVDYSQQSIELARKLARVYLGLGPRPSSVSSHSGGAGEITFQVLDLIHDTPHEQAWWPRAPNADVIANGGAETQTQTTDGFDLVLDKGTFDAISLSASTVVDDATGRQRRICELYPSKVLDMVKSGGFLLVTSCNWTEDEVVAWFGGPATDVGLDTGVDAGRAASAKFEVYDRIKYPVFEFGGQKGQGVASVCFRKT